MRFSHFYYPFESRLFPSTHYALRFNQTLSRKKIAMTTTLANGWQKPPRMTSFFVPTFLIKPKDMETRIKLSPTKFKEIKINTRVCCFPYLICSIIDVFNSSSLLISHQIVIFDHRLAYFIFRQSNAYRFNNMAFITMMIENDSKELSHLLI